MRDGRTVVTRSHPTSGHAPLRVGIPAHPLISLQRSVGNARVHNALCGPVQRQEDAPPSPVDGSSWAETLRGQARGWLIDRLGEVFGAAAATVIESVVNAIVVALASATVLGLGLLALVALVETGVIAAATAFTITMGVIAAATIAGLVLAGLAVVGAVHNRYLEDAMDAALRGEDPDHGVLIRALRAVVRGTLDASTMGLTYVTEGLDGRRLSGGVLRGRARGDRIGLGLSFFASKRGARLISDRALAVSLAAGRSLRGWMRGWMRAPSAKPPSTPPPAPPAPAPSAPAAVPPSTVDPVLDLSLRPAPVTVSAPTSQPVLDPATIAALQALGPEPLDPMWFGETRAAPPELGQTWEQGTIETPGGTLTYTVCSGAREHAGLKVEVTDPGSGAHGFLTASYRQSTLCMVMHEMKLDEIPLPHRFVLDRDGTRQPLANRLLDIATRVLAERTWGAGTPPAMVTSQIDIELVSHRESVLKVAGLRPVTAKEMSAAVDRTPWMRFTKTWLARHHLRVKEVIAEKVHTVDVRAVVDPANPDGVRADHPLMARNRLEPGTVGWQFRALLLLEPKPRD